MSAQMFGPQMRNLFATVRRELGRGSSRFRRWLSADSSQGERQRARTAWGRIKGDLTCRLDYDLQPDSVVLDVGGYEGQWASDIYARYRCKIHLFEPVARYADFIATRFSRNPDIALHRYGLAARDGEAAFAIDGAGSSACLTSVFTTGRVPMRGVEEFFSLARLEEVDLMKINIEGGEYELLERMLELGLHERVRDMQIQFHDFVPQAARRAESIARRLSATHKLTYRYHFVWENWQRLPRCN